MTAIRKIAFRIIISMVSGLFVLSTAYAAPAPYAYPLDLFELSGNSMGTITDDFNDGIVDPNIWDIDDPAVIESGTTATFQNPGTVDTVVLGTINIQAEMSYVNSRFSMFEGLGSYDVISQWSPVIPGTNQFYTMDLSSLSTGQPDENVVIGVANFEPAIAAFFGAPSGPMIFFGWDNDAQAGNFDFQGYSFTSGDVTGDIILRLAFDDTTNLFSGSFSLNGGSTFFNPFTDVASQTGELLTEAELSLGGESWEVVPIPSSLVLMFFGIIGIIGLKRK